MPYDIQKHGSDNNYTSASKFSNIQVTTTIIIPYIYIDSVLHQFELSEIICCEPYNKYIVTHNYLETNIKRLKTKHT